MGQDHRVIDQKWLLLILLDKVADEVSADIRPILTIIIILRFAVDLEPGVAVAAVIALPFPGALAYVLPET